MKEEFLHYIWRYGLFDQKGLRTTEGLPIGIERAGYPHQDGGPDFQNALIRIGRTRWAGNVEIHFRSTQWYEHGHHRDPAYDNVILHVVLEANGPTINSSGRSLDTFELSGRIPHGIAASYERFTNDRKKRIPCEDLIEEVPELVIDDWLDRLAIERLERKRERIQRMWILSGKDPRECFYRLLGRYFGGRVNAVPFEQLTSRVPLRTLLRERDDIQRCEALLFGQAGLLHEDLRGEYPRTLLKEYRYLRRKYGLRPMDPSGWRFLRLRPADFPTIRIAQFAALIHQRGDPWEAFERMDQGPEMQRIFQVTASSYWKDHYKFGRERKQKGHARCGKGMARRLLINACVPFLFFYGAKKKEGSLKERAIAILESLEPEEDRIQRKWKRAGIFPANAFRSQGAIELMEAYCDPRRCLHCAIGDHILKKRA